MKIIFRILGLIVTAAFIVANKVFWLPVTIQAMFSYRKEKLVFKEAFKDAKTKDGPLLITDKHDSSMTHLFFVFPTIMTICSITKNDKNRDSLLLPFLARDNLRLATLYAIAYYGRYA